MEQKGLNDMYMKNNTNPDKSHKSMEEIEEMINNTKIVESTKSKMPYLVIGLIIVVIVLIILLIILNNKIN